MLFITVATITVIADTLIKFLRKFSIVQVYRYAYSQEICEIMYDFYCMLNGKMICLCFSLISEGTTLLQLFSVHLLILPSPVIWNLWPTPSVLKSEKGPENYWVPKVFIKYWILHEKDKNYYPTRGRIAAWAHYTWISHEIHSNPVSAYCPAVVSAVLEKVGNTLCVCW